jgi:hypothetical protein
MLDLANAARVGVLSIEYDIPSDDVVLVYCLPYFVASFIARAGADKVLDKIETLDNATIFADSSVVLTDGRMLAAVELPAVQIRTEHTPLEWKIVHTTVANIGTPDCYRSLRHGLPPELQRYVPDHRFLDCSKLKGLSGRPSKEIERWIAKRGLPVPSRQTIANALHAFGIGLSRHRPSRQSHNSAETSLASRW